MSVSEKLPAHLTAHAILRYCERALEMDLTRFRRKGPLALAVDDWSVLGRLQIAQPKLVDGIIARLSTPTIIGCCAIQVACIKIDGIFFAVKEGRITSALPVNWVTRKRRSGLGGGDGYTRRGGGVRRRRQREFERRQEGGNHDQD
jgi:hypothetical protein